MYVCVHVCLSKWDDDPSWLNYFFGMAGPGYIHALTREKCRIVVSSCMHAAFILRICMVKWLFLVRSFSQCWTGGLGTELWKYPRS